MKKRIVFKIRKYPTVSETFIVFNIVAAIKSGYDVTIIADQLGEGDSGTQPHLDAKYQLAQKVRVPKPPLKFWPRGFTAIAYLLNPDILFYFIKYCSLKKNWSLAHLFSLKFYAPLRKNTIFHVHFSNREKPLFDLKKIGFLKSPIIVTFHGFDVHRIPDHPSFSKERSDLNTFAAAITTNSNYLKDQALLKGIREDLMSVIPVGLDVGMFQPKIAPLAASVVKIISVGRLVPVKGHALGIAAIQILLEKGYDVTYTIIGEGEEKASLEKLILELGIADNVQIIDFKNQAVLKEYYAAADIFLLPSTTDEAGRQETFGVVSLEAQAMGLPVVGFDCGGFPETLEIGQSGFVVQDGNVALLAEKLALLIDDPSLRIRMGQSGIANVHTNFSNEKTVHKYLKLYETV